MTMNLFEIHDYIESVENRVEILEKLVIEDRGKGQFYYDHYKKAKRDIG